MKKNTRFNLKLMAAVAVLVLFQAADLLAWSRGAMLSPTRVVMEGRDRAAVVKIINPDEETNQYRISLIAMRMDESGRRQEVQDTTPEEQAVLDMIRFSPRRVTLGAKEWQTVRIMVRKPADLAPGEYRAHLKVVPIAPDKTSGQTEKDGDAQMSVNLNLLFAITIPVIIRHGEGGVTLTPEKPVIQTDNTGAASLQTRLSRNGSHSAFFDIFAYAQKNGQRQKVGALLGVSIYTPNEDFILSIPLEPGQGTGLAGQPLELEIRDKEKRTLPLDSTWKFILD